MSQFLWYWWEGGHNFGSWNHLTFCTNFYHFTPFFNFCSPENDRHLRFMCGCLVMVTIVVQCVILWPGSNRCGLVYLLPVSVLYCRHTEILNFQQITCILWFSTKFQMCSIVKDSANISCHLQQWHFFPVKIHILRRGKGTWKSCLGKSISSH